MTRALLQQALEALKFRSYGDQYDNHIITKGRAVAVRRVLIGE